MVLIKRVKCKLTHRKTHTTHTQALRTRFVLLFARQSCIIIIIIIISYLFISNTIWIWGNNIAMGDSMSLTIQTVTALRQ